MLWGFHFLVLRGVKQAAALNTIATFAKIVPLAIFVVVAIAGFRADIFALNFWGGDAPRRWPTWRARCATRCSSPCSCSSASRARASTRATRSNRDDVGIATVLGFLGVLALLVLVTMLSYGVLLRPDLAALQTPSLAGVMEALVGRWGTVFISVGLLISVLGNYLSWSLLAAEVMHSAASNDTMPPFLARRESPRACRRRRCGRPTSSSRRSSSWRYFAEYAFTLALKMTSAMTLVPYLLVAAYGLKLAWTRETYAAIRAGATRTSSSARWRPPTRWR